MRLLVISALLLEGVGAAQVRVPTTARGVDVVTLADGERVLGAVASRNEREVVVAVRQAWLKEHFPDRHEALQADGERRRRATHDLRIARIAAWRNEADHVGLSRFLDGEAKRLDEAFTKAGEEPPEPSEFVLLPLAMTDVRRVYVQPVPRRRIALLAWREGLEDVEDRAADALGRELRRRNVAMPVGPVDLSDRFPTETSDEDPATWSARRALVEYQYVEPVDFQGTGGVLIRTTGRDADPGLEEVLAAFAKPAAGLNLLDLIDPPKGAPKRAAMNAPKLDAAIEETTKRGRSGFRATWVSPDLAANRVTVETRFVAKLPDGWRTVWRHASVADATKARPEFERRIVADERVGRLLTTIRALGANAEGAVTTAVRFGAATMEAQSAADEAFGEFTSTAGASLEAPWPR